MWCVFRLIVTDDMVGLHCLCPLLHAGMLGKLPKFGDEYWGYVFISLNARSATRSVWTQSSPSRITGGKGPNRSGRSSLSD